jgi:branched-chain amino acid aminotransferase
VTEEIQSRFFDVVERRVDAHEDWFTFVDEV